MELLFTLTHPELIHKVICDMVTLPRCKSTIKSVDQLPADETADNTVGTTGGNCITCVGIVCYYYTLL